jgi:predicted small lipoprotein YifL
MKNNLMFFALLAAILAIASCSTKGSTTGPKKAANPFGEKPSCSTADPKKTSKPSGNNPPCRAADPAEGTPSWDSSSNVGKQ